MRRLKPQGHSYFSVPQSYALLYVQVFKSHLRMTNVRPTIFCARFLLHSGLRDDKCQRIKLSIFIQGIHVGFDDNSYPALPERKMVQQIWPALRARYEKEFCMRDGLSAELHHTRRSGFSQVCHAVGWGRTSKTEPKLQSKNSKMGKTDVWCCSCDPLKNPRSAEIVKFSLGPRYFKIARRQKSARNIGAHALSYSRSTRSQTARLLTMMR